MPPIIYLIATAIILTPIIVGIIADLKHKKEYPPRWLIALITEIILFAVAIAMYSSKKASEYYIAWIAIAVIVIGLAILIIPKIVLMTKNRQNNAEIKTLAKNIKNYEYGQKQYQTGTEKEFYDKLIRATFELDIQIIPQIPLSSVIKKYGSRYQNELYRIIDYGIFDKDYNLLLLIELNDQTHLQTERKTRDAKVKEICNKANIKLITFWTNCNNEIECIKHRIKNILAGYEDIENEE